MKNYVLASVDRGESRSRVVYLEEIGSEIWYSDVTKAMRFDFEEILEFVKSHKSLAFLGFCVVRIEDCTFQRFEESEELVRKYSLPEYALR